MIAHWLVAVAWAGALDVNAAGADELAQVPGLGPVKAAAIVAYRQQHGAFARWEDLDEVPGMGSASLAALRPFLVVRASTAPVPTQAPPVPLAADRTPFDPNRANTFELAALPGLSAALAEAIVADRDANGPFVDCADLGRVDGVGPATVAVLAERCRFGNARDPLSDP